MSIPIGSRITLNDENNPVEVEVIEARKVRYNGIDYSLSTLTCELLNLSYNVRPMRYWRYNDKLLTEYYNETYNDAE